MKSRVGKMWLCTMLILCLSVAFVGCTGSGTTEQEPGVVEPAEQSATLGDYNVEIKSCRMAKDYEGKDVVIVLYSYTNNSDSAAAFYMTFEDEVYQDGIGLNEAYVLADSANYDDGNAMKEIKPGATLEVERAYELNDTTTDIEVEVKELISFSDDVVTKVFKIEQ